MFATLAGGYPWPPDLPAPAALEVVVGAQVEAGLGLLSDGRVHPAGTAAGDLVAAWAAARDAAVARARAAAAGGTSALPVKLAVEGPFAAAGPEGALDAAQRQNRALRALAEAGCPVVEVHEPAATLPVDDPGRTSFAEAHRALLAGLPDAVHATLAITGGDTARLGSQALFAAPYLSYLFDLVAGPDNWRLIAVAPPERGIVAGVGDATGHRRTRIEDVVWAASYAASTQGRGLDRVGIAPCGSLAGLEPAGAREVLDLLGEAVRTIAGGRDEVLARLDPRAVDARSAALGHYRPGRRRDPAGR